MNITIFDEQWSIQVLEQDDFNHKFGTKTHALTNIDDKTLYFRDGDHEDNVVAHECAHVVYYYMIILDLGLKPDQFEEFVAEFTGKYHKKITKLVKSIQVLIRQSKKGNKK